MHDALLPNSLFRLRGRYRARMPSWDRIASAFTLEQFLTPDDLRVIRVANLEPGALLRDRDDALQVHFADALQRNTSQPVGNAGRHKIGHCAALNSSYGFPALKRSEAIVLTSPFTVTLCSRVK